MTVEQQVEWIKTLKVGDRIAMVGWDHWRTTRYGVVSRFTPTQVIVTRNGDCAQIRFDKRNGVQVPRSVSEFSICPEAEAKEIRLRTRIQNQNWWKLPIQALEKIDGILENYRDTPGERVFEQ